MRGAALGQKPFTSCHYSKEALLSRKLFFYPQVVSYGQKKRSNLIGPVYFPTLLRARTLATHHVNYKDKKGAAFSRKARECVFFQSHKHICDKKYRVEWKSKKKKKKSNKQSPTNLGATPLNIFFKKIHSCITKLESCCIYNFLSQFLCFILRVFPILQIFNVINLIALFSFLLRFVKCFFCPLSCHNCLLDISPGCVRLSLFQSCLWSFLNNVAAIKYSETLLSWTYFPFMIKLNWN